jgi:hypothetical protein
MSKLFTNLTLLGLAFAAVVASAQNRPSAAEERLISALLTVNFENIYADDGAADGTVTDAGMVKARTATKRTPRCTRFSILARARFRSCLSTSTICA